MKQKIISIAAFLALCLALLPGAARAEDTGNTGITIGSSTQSATWRAEDTDGLNGILSFDVESFEVPDNVITDYVSKLNLAAKSTGRVQTTDSSGNITGIYENNGKKKELSPLGKLDLSSPDFVYDPANELLYGYKWKATTGKDEYGDTIITSAKLTLAKGFNAEKVILPDAAVEIVTTGESRIGELVGYDIDGIGPQKTELTFSGTEPLTVDKRINLAGGAGNTITVAAGAKVAANKGIYVGSTGESSVTVNGILKATGYYDDQYKSNVPAVSAGKVEVHDTGVLEVSGGAGVMLNGMSGVFTNLFTVAGEGRFTANCLEYNIRVVASGSIPPGTTAEGAIALGADYMPADCEAKLEENAINLVRISTGKVYAGPLTIHQNHNWLKTWSIDKNKHWYDCTFEGCDKKQSEGSHNFETDGVCSGCGAKLEVALTGDKNLVYDGTAKTFGVTVTISKDAETPITLAKDTDYTVTYQDNTNAGTGKVTVSSKGGSWEVVKEFTIGKAPLEISVTAKEKTYDGSNHADVTVVFNGLQNDETLAPGTDYTVNGKFESADAGENKRVSGTVTLLSGNTAKNYALSDGDFSTTGKIKKATVSGAEPQSMNIANNLESTYIFRLSRLRPDISGNWGDVKYTIDEVNIPEGYYSGGAQIIAGPSGALNTLSLPILRNAVETTGQVGTVTVTVKSSNYEDFINKIQIVAENKEKVSFGGVEGVTTVYNGQPAAGYTGTLTVTDSDGKPVELEPEILYTDRLSTAWGQAATPPTNAGTYFVVFRVPDNNPKYIGHESVPFEIKPATVTITADDKQAEAGSAMPALTCTVTGLAGGDTLAAEPDLACDADMSKAGSYPITVSGAAVPDGGNYDTTITYVAGTLRVTARSSGGGGGSGSAYAVTVEQSEHGKVTANRTSAGSGSTVTLTVTPDSGYALDALTVTDSRGGEIRPAAQGGGKYTFTMPGRTVTVRAVFAPLPDGAACDGGEDCPSRGFADLGGAEAWYHAAVDDALRNGLMHGYGNGLFGPDDALTRAQFVQILYNRAGRPAVTGGGVFADVAPDAWYAPAVAWAAARGVADGYGDGRFGPDDGITREQLAVMLWRYAGSPAAAEQALRFDDADKADGYALEALRWAVENGVLRGEGGGVLDPKGPATRAQTAQMLKNFKENPEKTFDTGAG